MKTYAWILLSGGIFGAVMATNACGGSDTGTGGGGGGKTTSTSSSSSSSSTSTSSGAAANCADYLDTTNDCGSCLETSCCDSVAACGNDADCLACAQDPTGSGCDTNALYAAFISCQDSKCTTACAPPKSECNPVTNAGCTGGTGCDLSGAQVFSCFGDATINTQDVCATCTNDTAGPWCKPGMHCNDLVTNPACTRYCCNDADCGANGTCDMTNTIEGVGLCMPVTGDAGLPDGGVEGAVCDAPATPPSNGSCFTGLSGADAG